MTIEIDDRLVPQLRIRDHDEQAVELLKLGREQADLLNGTGNGTGIDRFPDLERLLHQDHHTRCHIAERAL